MNSPLKQKQIRHQTNHNSFIRSTQFIRRNRYIGILVPLQRSQDSSSSNNNGSNINNSKLNNISIDSSGGAALECNDVQNSLQLEQSLEIQNDKNSEKLGGGKNSTQQTRFDKWKELGRLICKELGLFQDVDKFKVPWGFSSIIKVLLWWILSFLFVVQFCIPFGCKLLDLDRNNLSPRGAATLHLLLDTLQIAITYLILAFELRPYKSLRQRLFPFRLRPIGWLLLVVLGCLLFPCVDWLAVVCSRWFPMKEDVWVENIELSFQIGDAITHSLYLFLVSLCAPLWEETIFRGFLIPSLSRYMPLGFSILASSLIFGLAHFSLQRVLPLMMLGVVIGGVYVASGNLLSAVLLHSLWNFWVFWQLFAQHVAGQDSWSFTQFVVKIVATLWSSCNGVWP
eukprot:TRINITY_DN1858_c0_g1_i6.p1 TRINITY_DN1858_c0_g1~~TRINITY_DN1858_c0_g1_i6.p1  ORF type:complete len:397 (+),score=31.97 TRINITY_DN1858_c0_g1_i6:96-1286(+)